MTDKDLRRLSRNDLLQILLDQTREMEQLKEKYEKMEAALDDRTLVIAESGSIAEAALKLNGVFQAAQEACRQYTDNIAQRSRQTEDLCAQREEQSRLQAQQILDDAQAKSDEILRSAEEKAAAMLSDAQTKSDEMVSTAQARSQAYWDAVSEKLMAFAKQHAELASLLSPEGRK